ncbi:MAG: hypothetical protein NC924_09780, partial [Candidatus Omnitrophica bacterium]|nr:hypothetical protein [Candidatus Omnitrophota bacterium]
ILEHGVWIPEWCFAVSHAVTAGMRDKLKTALIDLKLENPQAAEILHTLKIKSIIPAQDSDWNDYRGVCDKAGYIY